MFKTVEICASGILIICIVSTLTAEQILTLMNTWWVVTVLTSNQLSKECVYPSWEMSSSQTSRLQVLSITHHFILMIDAGSLLQELLDNVEVTFSRSFLYRSVAALKWNSGLINIATTMIWSEAKQWHSNTSQNIFIPELYTAQSPTRW